jgi:hypothetical protein
MRVVLYSDPTSVAGVYAAAARAGVTATRSTVAATARVTSAWSPRRHDQASRSSCINDPPVSGGGRVLVIPVIDPAPSPPHWRDDVHDIRTSA